MTAERGGRRPATGFSRAWPGAGGARAAACRSAGNPLALIELPAALKSEQLDGGVLLPSRLPLTARLERAFAAQGAGLPSATRWLLLAAAAEDAAAEDADVVGEVLNAAAILDGGAVTVDAFTPGWLSRWWER